MLRAQRHRQAPVGSKGALEARMQSMVVFSVGGQRLAARTDEIGGVMPWPGTIVVPSETPFVIGLVRQGKGCLPVFDLAAKFNRLVEERDRLCLLVKHVDGPLAICIDSHVPSLHTIARSAVQYRAGNDPDLAGICIAGGEELPIINLTTLGVSSNRPA